MDLFRVQTVEAAKRIMEEAFWDYRIDVETVHISGALNRILAEDVFSDSNVPHFRRSTVDGYAVIAKETFGAGESSPAFFEVAGDVEMGHPPKYEVIPGKAVYVPTGGALPEGADAVVMVEYAEELGDESIAVYRPAAPGENIMNIGDDIKEGDRVLHKGIRLRPQDIGVLASIGVQRVNVCLRPRFSIISTGDEVVGTGEQPGIGQIRDINTYTLAAMVENSGGIVVRSEIAGDDYEKLRCLLESCLMQSDIVLLSGGSSVGTKDWTSKVLNSMGEPGVLVHGLAVKPGKPTIIAKVKGKPVFGLPGQPASAMVIFKVIVEYLTGNILKAGMNQEYYIQAEASVNIHSAPGKETYQMVALENDGGKWIAVPVHGKSGMITLMSRSQGFIRIDASAEGIKKGEPVRVILF